MSGTSRRSREPSELRGEPAVMVSAAPAPERGPAAGTGVRETVLMAGASGLSFLASLARTKVLALGWGPVGVGGVGLMQASLSTATLVGGLGVDGVVTRDYAAAASPEERSQLAAAVRKGMLVLASVAGAVAWAVFFLFRERLGFAGWLDALGIGAAVALAIVAANLRSLIAGDRRIRAVAGASIASAVLAAVLVVTVVLLADGPVAWSVAVLAVPLAQVLVLWRSAWRVPGGGQHALGSAVRFALRLCFRARILAVAGVIPVLSQLLLRLLARGSLGPVEFGGFQAVLSLAAISTSVLASSVGPSILPQLSAQAGDPRALAARALGHAWDYIVLYAPVAFGLQVLPELAMRLLFSSEFGPAAPQLAWQVSGELLRLPCWVLAAVLSARGLFRQYFWSELLTMGAVLGATHIGLTVGSPEALGLALSAGALGQFLGLFGLCRISGLPLPWRFLALCLGLWALSLASAFLAGAFPVGWVFAAGVFIGSGALAVRLLLRTYLKRGGP